MTRRAWRSGILGALAVVAGIALGVLAGSMMHHDEPISYSHCATSAARYVDLYGSTPSVAVVNHYDGSSDYYRLPHTADMVCG